MIKQLALAGVITLALAGTATAQSTAPAAAPAPTMHAMAPVKHDSKADITLAQQTLAKDGRYKGKVNGQWSGDLTAALKKYQTQNKLKVTGKLDDATFTKMKTVTPAAAATPGT